MKGVPAIAASATEHRRPVADDNPYLALQSQISDQITATPQASQASSDRMSEQMFFGIYGTPWVQTLMGISADAPVRPLPADSPARQQSRQQARANLADKLHHGGFDEALTRAVLYTTAAERVIDQRSALALNEARKQVMHLSLVAFKMVVRDQFAILQCEREGAVDAIADLVPKADARRLLLDQVRGVVAAGGAPKPIERERLDRLAQLLAGGSGKPRALARPRRVAHPRG